eukprot:GFUD01113809.1.p1 GENE.GFUD01113809.1~~GFUD01113809.1.p1  ORF type:complete len:222 (-),score=56.75 GFUD01113809.1:17-682(-)
MMKTKHKKNDRKPRFLGISDLKLKFEKQNLAHLCFSKLAKISDPQAKLRKSVLINNTLKYLQKDWNDMLEHTDSEENQQPEESACLISDDVYIDSSKTQYNDTLIDDKTQSLCDDIINEFLGVCDIKKETVPQNKHNSLLNFYDKCNVQKNSNFHQEKLYKLLKQETLCKSLNQEKLHKSFNQETLYKSISQLSKQDISPYSYGSFLSEVYRDTLKCGVEL